MSGTVMKPVLVGVSPTKCSKREMKIGYNRGTPTTAAKSEAAEEVLYKHKII